ncbi:MAG: LamG domain-containing protein [Myxococcota bacterium]|nr:LamG domain-containing protein [Myxococcota bacterium]
MELSIRPTESPDCDANNNWRIVMLKGDAGLGVSFVLEQNLAVAARVQTAAGEYAITSPGPVRLGRWTHLAVAYEETTGRMELWLDGALAKVAAHPPSPLAPPSGQFTFGGPVGAAATCPAAAGSFVGELRDFDV